MRPYDASLIADYVILSLTCDERYFLINLKLQKLLYYIQAWSLGINGYAMINGRFEAWVHGPVCIELYNRFKDTKSLYSSITDEDVLNKSPKGEILSEDVEFIDYILENYARYSGLQIEAMTRNDAPWINARKGYGAMERCHAEITEEVMKDYYAKKYEDLPD